MKPFTGFTVPIYKPFQGGSCPAQLIHKVNTARSQTSFQHHVAVQDLHGQAELWGAPTLKMKGAPAPALPGSVVSSQSFPLRKQELYLIVAGQE